MFTGIVEEMGTIQKIERGSQSAVLSICCEKVLEGTQIGDSIAVNGVCLTVTSLRSDGYDADVMAETMNRSSLGLLLREAVQFLSVRCQRMDDLADISSQGMWTEPGLLSK